jgi:chromosomal replication initiation ATPase DnaA
MTNIKTMYGTTDEIIEKVANSFGITLEQAKSKCRNLENINARFVSMYFLRFHCKLPLRIIADVFDKDCHSTIIHGIKRVEERKLDPTFLFYYNQAIENINR